MNMHLIQMIHTQIQQNNVQFSKTQNAAQKTRQVMIKICIPNFDKFLTQLVHNSYTTDCESYTTSFLYFGIFSCKIFYGNA